MIVQVLIKLEMFCLYFHSHIIVPLPLHNRYIAAKSVPPPHPHPATYGGTSSRSIWEISTIFALNAEKDLLGKIKCCSIVIAAAENDTDYYYFKIMEVKISEGEGGE